MHSTLKGGRNSNPDCLRGRRGKLSRDSSLGDDDTSVLSDGQVP